jgi:hypothetical protein
LVIVVVPRFRLRLDNTTLPKITAMAAESSAASYTTSGDTTATSNETGCQQGVDVVPEVEQVLMEKPVSTPPAK